MRFYTKQHKAYCGIDLHARRMYVCILSQDGESLLHRNMKTSPEMFLKAIAPSRADLVVAVECIFPWYGLADLCAREDIPFVLGHALSMKAIHGGKANKRYDRRSEDCRTPAGGHVATGVRLSCRYAGDSGAAPAPEPLVRKRAELLTHVQQTNRQYTVPEIGTAIAYKTNRPGVAERFADPAVHKSVEVDLALHRL